MDCLLPGKIRKLGRHVTTLMPRQALKTTALDCEIRGGEYVSYDRATYETALRVWMPDAERGDAKAQNYVGEIYERGLGVDPDYAVAATWYRKAAEQGYAPAQINLGQLLEQGLGVPKDVNAAFEWYQRASGLAKVNVPFVAEPPRAAAPPPAPPPDDATARELEQARAELARTRAEMERLRAERSEESASGTAAREALQQERDLKEQEAEQLRRQLDAERQRLQQEVEQLRQQREADAARAAEAAAQRPPPEPAAPPSPPVVVEAPAPTIVLIDPQLPASRGALVVRTAAGVRERVLIGRVEAPGGLLSLTVNDAEIPVADTGIFQGRVRLAGDETPVSIVAVDRQGKREEKQLTLAAEKPAPVAPATAPEAPPAPPPPARPAIDFGSFHALVIGNDRYERLPKLDTAVADAEAVAGILRSKYGFQVTLLENATRYEILSALNKLRAELTEKDNLLIYYAGHGEIDEANMRGNWLPVDAEPDSTANWISNASLTDLLNAMAARHILVVADSCYSGALTRSSMARLERGMTREARVAWQSQMVKGRSRTALTSGGVAPVLDGGGGKHSVFAKALLNVLEKNDDVLEGQRLFSELSALVTWAAEAQRFEQLPEYAPIKFAGHESGDFFFVPGI